MPFGCHSCHCSLTASCRDFFESTWHELKADIFDKDSKLFPANVFSFDNFLWAVATLRSRVHPPLQGKQVAMVPLADLVSSCTSLQPFCRRLTGMQLASIGLSYTCACALHCQHVALCCSLWACACGAYIFHADQLIPGAYNQRNACVSINVFC